MPEPRRATTPGHTPAKVEPTPFGERPSEVHVETPTKPTKGPGYTEEDVARSDAIAHVYLNTPDPTVPTDPAKGTIVTGVDTALVNTADSGVVAVALGEALPENLADGEKDRLTKLGVFAVHPFRPLA